MSLLFPLTDCEFSLCLALLLWVKSVWLEGLEVRGLSSRPEIVIRNHRSRSVSEIPRRVRMRQVIQHIGRTSWPTDRCVSLYPGRSLNGYGACIMGRKRSDPARRQEGVHHDERGGTPAGLDATDRRRDLPRPERVRGRRSRRARTVTRHRGSESYGRFPRARWRASLRPWYRISAVGQAVRGASPCWASPVP